MGGEAGGGDEDQVVEGEVRTEHQCLQQRECSVRCSHYHYARVHHTLHREGGWLEVTRERGSFSSPLARE